MNNSEARGRCDKYFRKNNDRAKLTYYRTASWEIVF